MQLSDLTAHQARTTQATDLARWVKALYNTGGESSSALQFFELAWPRSVSRDLITKAAIAAGTTTDASWAGPLAPIKPLEDSFLELVRPASILGRIPNLRKVPFNISVPMATGGAAFSWVGQGLPKPLSSAAFSTVNLTIAKTIGLVVVTAELLKLSTPAADATLRDDMVAGCAQFLDQEFTDPSKAPIANVSPGSITNGITPITSAGPTPANALTDVKALISAFTAANKTWDGAVLLMSPANLTALYVARNIEPPTPPTMFGVRVIESASCGSNIIMFDPRAILVADDGGVTFLPSKAATIQMDSAPDAPPTASTTTVSLWQSDLVGLRTERTITWKRSRSSAVAYVANASYT